MRKTKNTIDFLKKGYADEYLAKDIEEDNLKHIIFDINNIYGDSCEKNMKKIK